MSQIVNRTFDRRDFRQEEVKGEENQSIVNEEEVGTFRDSRRVAKSVERTARGAPIPEAHYEEYGVKQQHSTSSVFLSAQAIRLQQQVKPGQRSPHHSIVNRSNMSQGRHALYSDQEIPTVRRGVSQALTQFQQPPQQRQPDDEFVMVDASRPSVADEPSGGGFSIMNLKNSLMSKISNIFNTTPEQQHPQPPPAKIKPPNCGGQPGTPYMCKEAFQWFSLYNSRSIVNGVLAPEKYIKLKKVYKELLQQSVPKETENQINRDLYRTFPLHQYYSEGAPGVEKMRRVLTAFANYDHQVDYVQGMNFIVGSLLYHANDVMAFWLFVSLIEDCEMRDIYMRELPGLFKHSHIINHLVTTHLTDLSDHFEEHNLRVEMYASDWIFGLFASVIPLEQMACFFSKFYRHRWMFFYQLILSILKFLEKELLQEDELWSILNQIKSQTFHNSAAVSNLSPQVKPSHSRVLQMRTSLEEGGLRGDQSRVVGLIKKIFLGRQGLGEDGQFWPQLIERCQVEWRDKLNEPVIYIMLKNFDPESTKFHHD